MRALVLAVVLLLAGCAVSPETPEQRLAYAESQVTAVAEQAVEMRQNGNLSDEDYEKVLGLLESANRSLDAAWNALEHDDDLSGHLNTVEEILTVVKEELE